VKKTRKGEQHSKVYQCQRDKKKATTVPVASVDELKGIWCRIFDCYTMQVVQVTARKGSRVSFRLVEIDEEAPKQDEKTYSVDLDDGEMAWGDLPSTAQLVDPRSTKTIAYLGLTEAWFKKNLPKHRERVVKLMMRGPKLPPDCSL